MQIQTLAWKQIRDTGWKIQTRLGGRIPLKLPSLAHHSTSGNLRTWWLRYYSWHRAGPGSPYIYSSGCESGFKTHKSLNKWWVKNRLALLSHLHKHEAQQWVISTPEPNFHPISRLRLDVLFVFAAPYITLATALDFSNASWIWTNELPKPGGPIPLGSRAFRRFVPTPQGVLPFLANVLISVDNAYTLFINGQTIGTGTNATFHQAQSFCVPLSSPCGTLIAVNGSNINDTIGLNTAGILAKIQITYSDGSTQTVVSDARWKALNTSSIPAGFNQSFFDDSAWPNAVTEGVIGSPPWGNITLPSNTSCGNS